MTDKRIFRASQVDSSRSGWVADMSGPDAVNPDAYFFWDSQAQATQFVALVDDGMQVGEAVYTVHSESAAAQLGRKGGKSTSPAKSAAAQANGKRGGRPRKATE